MYHANTIPSRPPSPADLWSDKDAFGDRAHFRVSTWPAVLKVTGVQRYDAGTYTCRVDFRQAPTVYHHVTLDVIGRLLKLITWLQCICKSLLRYLYHIRTMPIILDSSKNELYYTYMYRHV